MANRPVTNQPLQFIKILRDAKYRVGYEWVRSGDISRIIPTESSRCVLELFSGTTIECIESAETILSRIEGMNIDA